METIESLDAEIAQAEKDREAVFEKMRPIQNRAAQLYAIIEAKKNRRGLLLLKKAQDEGVTPWEWLLDASDRPESSVRYNACNKALQDLGLHTGMGYWTDTGQTVIQIALHEQDCEDNRKQLEAVKTLLPFIKPGESGGKKIKIFEHTLSAATSYHLEFFTDRIKIVSRWSYDPEFKTIEEAFAYVAKNYWYSSDSEDEDDE